VALSEDGKHIVTAGRVVQPGNPPESDYTAILWDAASGAALQTFKADRGSYFASVALSRDGKHVVTGGTAVILWEAASGRKLRTFEGHGMALSRDGQHLWTASPGAARLWDPATGKERCRLYVFDAGKEWLVVTPDGSFDGSEGAWRFVTYRVPGTSRVVDDDATRRRFHRPGLLAQIWKGDK
jgi:WD40 repeat protein